MVRINLKALLASMLLAALSTACAPVDKQASNDCNPGDLGCACFANMTCNRGLDGRWMYCAAGFVCAETECTPGAEGCGCLFDSRCDDGLACVEQDAGAGICEPTSCRVGEPGCGCRADRTCDDSEDGTANVCDGQRCVPVNQSCPPGAENCPCHPNLECEGGLFCNTTSYRCGPSTVNPGELGAPCADNAGCNSGLECDPFDKTCQDVSCVRGQEGCGCLPNLACDTSGDGPSLICTADGTCRRTDCYAGELGCGCRADGQCNSSNATCERSICVPFEPVEGTAVSTEPAITASCYLPCRESLTLSNGVYKRCESDGLMAFSEGEACLPQTRAEVNLQVTEIETTCRQGSCLAEGESPRACGSDLELHADLECPEFQACIGGVCVSNCSSDADCRSGRVCDKHVCRTSCTVDIAGQCPSGEYCAVANGVSGTCRPLSHPEGEPSRSVEGSFTVSTPALQFSNIRVEQRFRIKNDSPGRQVFRVSKFADTSADALPDDPTPLYWLKLGYADVAPDGATGQTIAAPQQVQTLEVAIESGSTAEIIVAGAGGQAASRAIWQGTLEVVNSELGRRAIEMSYIQRPEGQWMGKMYYFGDFRVDATRLNDWIALGRPKSYAFNIGNAFIQRWIAMRAASIKLAEFEAILQSTLTASWDFQNVRDACGDPTNKRVCYPWPDAVDNNGVGVYTTNPETEPIPRGLIELPFAMNLSLSSNGLEMSGRIDSGASLHYAGNPAAKVKLMQNPTASGTGFCDPDIYTREKICVVRLSEFSSKIVVGGRFASDSPETQCPDSHASLTSVTFPWLLDAFTASPGVARDPQTGMLLKSECRQKTSPTSSANNTSEGGGEASNLNFSGANPIPDGRARVRQLTLVDGILVDQSRLLIIFKESYGSFVGDVGNEEFAGYGMMVLRRSTAQLEGQDFVGQEQADTSTGSPSALGAVCDRELLELNNEVPGVAPNGAKASTRLGLMINGVIAAPNDDDFVIPDPRRNFYANRDPEFAVHYVCHTTGRFDDCGARLGTRFAECPVGSGVTFLMFRRAQLGSTDLCTQPCNQDGSCLSLVETSSKESTPWLTENGGSVHPAWRCEDSNEVICDSDRFDLRQDKRFYRLDALEPPVMSPFLTEVSDAFRYKSRFRNREGTNIGFSPKPCIPGSESMQYCYSGEDIENLSRRVECVLSTYTDDTLRNAIGSSSPSTRTTARDFLSEAFGAKYGTDGSLERDGFESLYAELMVMLGDEAYTAAFGSRFDLAGIRGGAFFGSMFEDQGFDLAGPAGYEMKSLYEATQAYQLVLDRFYRLGPSLWKSLRMSDSEAFLGKETALHYLTRLVRASSQKARAWSAIAERYQSFNRPDLARRVVERAYTSAYIESVALGRFLRELRNKLAINQRVQIDSESNRAQRVYNSALLEMRDIYQDISDEVTLFGFPPEYIPFPALDPGDRNAFERLLANALEKTSIAAEKEETALQQNRAYETDRASFERELTQIRNTYEDRLAQICGTFADDSGRVYPAISKYADQTDKTLQFGDPCGFVGNGEIFQTLGQAEILRLELMKVIESRDSILKSIEIEKQRAAQQCEVIRDKADIEFKLGSEQTSLQQQVRQNQTESDRIKRDLSTFQALNQMLICGGLDCGPAAVLGAAFSFQAGIAEIGLRSSEDRIEKKRKRVEALTLARNQDLTLLGCEQVKVDSWAAIQKELLALEQNGLDATIADYNIRLKLAEMVRLKNEATRLANEQGEAEQLAINVEAARNDPNTRIYKNDAILNAERTFENALVAAYKATRVFEYYTSQSYAHLNDLFLVRLVSRGDISLENYLWDLAEAFDDFEELYGNPDVRVAVFSAKNDLLSIPRVDPTGRTISEFERTGLLRAALTDTRRLDANGYLTIPFSTSVAQLSPLTRDHKVLYIEAEISGTGNGDQVGRLYLRQVGTGAVRGVEEGETYYRFPERTAVLNPFFNGQRPFAPEVYRNERMRDRPFVNSRWELVLNQRDERVNQDIDINAIDDIRLFVYYTDFTEL